MTRVRPLALGAVILALAVTACGQGAGTRGAPTAGGQRAVAAPSPISGPQMTPGGPVDATGYPPSYVDEAGRVFVRREFAHGTVLSSYTPDWGGRAPNYLLTDEPTGCAVDPREVLCIVVGMKSP